jgi:hypothetical protein
MASMSAHLSWSYRRRLLPVFVGVRGHILQDRLPNLPVLAAVPVVAAAHREPVVTRSGLA